MEHHYHVTRTKVTHHYVYAKNAHEAKRIVANEEGGDEAPEISMEAEYLGSPRANPDRPPGPPKPPKPSISIEEWA